MHYLRVSAVAGARSFCRLRSCGHVSVRAVGCVRIPGQPRVDPTAAGRSKRCPRVANPDTGRRLCWAAGGVKGSFRSSPGDAGRTRRNVAAGTPGTFRRTDPQTRPGCPRGPKKAQKWPRKAIKPAGPWFAVATGPTSSIIQRWWERSRQQGRSEAIGDDPDVAA